MATLSKRNMNYEFKSVILAAYLTRAMQNFEDEAANILLKHSSINGSLA